MTKKYFGLMRNWNTALFSHTKKFLCQAKQNVLVCLQGYFPSNFLFVYLQSVSGRFGFSLSFTNANKNNVVTSLVSLAKSLCGKEMQSKASPWAKTQPWEDRTSDVSGETLALNHISKAEFTACRSGWLTPFRAHPAQFPCAFMGAVTAAICYHLYNWNLAIWNSI